MGIISVFYNYHNTDLPMLEWAFASLSLPATGITLLKKKVQSPRQGEQRFSCGDCSTWPLLITRMASVFLGHTPEELSSQSLALIFGGLLLTHR